MWILSANSGFLSIVLADTEPGSGIPDPDRVMIRGRRQSHLQALQREHPRLAEFEIIQSPPHCDYGWRLIAPKALVAECMLDAVLGIDYRNFKGESHRHATELGDDYVAALHDIWSTLHRLQH